MRKFFCTSVLIGTIGAACLGGAALAGETEIGGFYSYAENNSTVIGKEDGSSVVMFGVKGLLIVDDQSNPWHGALMDCNGIGAYAADGTTQTEGGACMIIDPDGDVQRLPWRKTKPDGGTWEIAEGAGKFVNMTGSGTYVDGPLADGWFLNTWKFTQITP